MSSTIENGAPPGQDGQGAAPSKSGLTAAGKCPVRVLGRRDGFYFFLSPRGEYRALRYKDLSALGVDSLFEGQEAWLRTAFPRFGKARDGEEAPVIGYQAATAARWLMAECAAAGFFDPAAALRGASVWLDEIRRRRGGREIVDRGLLIHHGDGLIRVSSGEGAFPAIPREGGGLLAIETFPPGLVRSDAEGRMQVYPALPAESRPGSVAAKPEAMAELLDFLGRWNWLQPLNAPTLLLGWIACGVICGVLRWRPHIWVVGGAGSGKSELERLLSRLLASTVLRLSAPTEASVRQQLGASARAVMIDEIEPSELNMRAREVVELARLASTDRQAPTARGGLGGVATLFHVRACFYLTSILHAPLAPQDASRITVLELGELPEPVPAADAGEAQPFRELVERMAALGPGLRARMIYGWARLEANLDQYAEAFARAGRKARLADQYGTLLAAAWTLLSDQVVSSEQADREVAMLREGEILPDPASEGGPQRCLNHLLSTPIEETQASGHRLSGTVTVAVWKNHEDNTYRDALALCGLRVVKRPAEDPRGGFELWVANDHRGLRRLYADSHWREGVWAQELKRLPGAHAGTAPQRIGGVKVRYTAVPCELIGKPWGEDGDAGDGVGGDGGEGVL